MQIVICKVFPGLQNSAWKGSWGSHCPPGLLKSLGDPSSLRADSAGGAWCHYNLLPPSRFFCQMNNLKPWATVTVMCRNSIQFQRANILWSAAKLPLAVSLNMKSSKDLGQGTLAFEGSWHFAPILGRKRDDLKSISFRTCTPLIMPQSSLPHFGMTQFYSDQSTENVVLCPYCAMYKFSPCTWLPIQQFGRVERVWAWEAGRQIWKHAMPLPNWLALYLVPLSQKCSLRYWSPHRKSHYILL